MRLTEFDHPDLSGISTARHRSCSSAHAARVLVGAGAIAILLLTSAAAQAQVRYRLEVNNTWSETTHPGAFPHEAHFSWFGGVIHNDQVTFWEEGELASPGITQMAEDGSTFILMNEVAAKVREGTAGRALSYRWWFCPTGTTAGGCGRTTVEFEIDEAWPLVTLVSMLGPSPDWFVGVSGLPLRENDRWRSRVVVDLRPYDNGSRSANQWALFGPRNNPPEPISLITEESGQLVGPGSLGTFVFTRLDNPRRLRGDGNNDGSVDVADVIHLVDLLFAGFNLLARASLDFPCATDDGNVAVLDVSGNETVDVSDIVALATFLFGGGPPPSGGTSCQELDEALGCSENAGCD